MCHGTIQPIKYKSANVPSSDYSSDHSTGSIKERWNNKSNGTAERSDWTNLKKSGTNQHESILVQHDYHDHSSDPVFDLSESSSLPNVAIMTSPRSGVQRRFTISHGEGNSSKIERNHGTAHHTVGSNTLSFPAKLYEMLFSVETNGHSGIVSWQPHRRSFTVHKPDKFIAIILPMYFQLSKMASFQRQLNLYGFKRLTIGHDKGGYYNELFLIGRSDLLPLIKREKIKGTGIRAKSNPDQEPDFWTAFPWIQATSSVVPTLIKSDSFQKGKSVSRRWSIPSKLNNTSSGKEFFDEINSHLKLRASFDNDLTSKTLTRYRSTRTAEPLSLVSSFESMYAPSSEGSSGTRLPTSLAYPQDRPRTFGQCVSSCGQEHEAFPDNGMFGCSRIMSSWGKPFHTVDCQGISENIFVPNLKPDEFDDDDDSSSSLNNYDDARSFMLDDDEFEMLVANDTIAG